VTFRLRRRAAERRRRSLVAPTILLDRGRPGIRANADSPLRPTTDAAGPAAGQAGGVTSLQIAHLVGLYAVVALLMILAAAQKKRLRWKQGHRCRACGAVGPHQCPRRLVP
jgi:hypothetical protein